MSDTSQAADTTFDMGATASTDTSDPNAQGVDLESGDGFTFDLEGTKADRGFPVIPAGKYNATIESMDYKLSQSSGKPMWQIRWSFSDGELAEKNRKIFSFHSFKPEQFGRVRALMDAIAPDLITKEFNPKKIADENQMVGRPAVLKLTIGKNQNNEDQNNVADVLKPGSASTTGGASSGSSEFKL